MKGTIIKFLLVTILFSCVNEESDDKWLTVSEFRSFLQEDNNITRLFRHKS